MPNAELITGHSSTNHVTSYQGAVMNAASIASKGRHILDIGNRCNLTLDGNTAYLDTGFIINQGRLIQITTETSFGLSSYYVSGSKKVLILGVTYNKTEEDYESSGIIMVEGVASESYVDPTYADNDLLTPETAELEDFDFMPLWRIKLDGNSVDSIERIAQMYYLDNTWRTAGIITNVDNPENLVAGPQARLRVQGTQVFLELDVQFVGTAINCTLNSEFIPPRTIISDRVRELIPNGYGGYTKYDETVTIDTSGNINIQQSTAGKYHSIRLSWFLD